MDMLGHQKDATLQGVPTSWGLKREGPVGERERVRLTEGHSLLEAGEEVRRRDTGKNQHCEGHRCMERERPSKGDILPEDPRERNTSGHGKRVNEQGVLTIWGPQEGHISVWKESD